VLCELEPDFPRDLDLKRLNLAILTDQPPAQGLK